MKVKILTLILCSAFSRSEGRSNDSISKADFIIRNVNVIPVTGDTILVNQLVAIGKGRISFLGKDVFPERIRSRATVIDGTGKYLIPGLADMHAHLPGEKSAFQEKEYLLLNLMNGVTTLRQMRGSYADLKLREQIREGQKTGPRLFVSTPYFWNGKTFNRRNAADSLDKYKASGFDFVKYLYGLKNGQYDTLLQAAKAAGFRVAGHTAEGGLEQAVKQGQASIEHIEPFLDLYRKDSLRFFEILSEMKSKEIFACPDLQWYVLEGYHTTIDHKESFLNKEFIDEKALEKWKNAFKENYQAMMAKDPVKFAGTILEDKRNADQFLQLLPLLHKYGIKLLISAGSGPFIQPGFSMKDEMLLFSRAGIGNYEILKCATLNAALFLNEGASRGTIETGKEADLVLLNSDPLESISNVSDVEGVFLFNRYCPRQTLVRELSGTF
jgi:imidazolonepropionase-like amidohydrolase